MGEELDPEVIFTPVQEIIDLLQAILDELVLQKAILVDIETNTGV